MLNQIDYIDIANLRVTIGSRDILRTAGFTLPGRKLITVLGKNGAGKTMFLRCLVGINPWGTGKTLLNGKTDILALPLLERSRLLTWIPEPAALAFPFSVYDVVLLGRYPWHRGTPTREDHKTTSATLHLLDLEKHRTDNVNSLSRGERQRVFLARGINNRSPVIVIDEPTAGLDLCQELRILDLLRDLTNRGKTVIVSLHNLECARQYSDFAVIISSGQMKIFPQADKAFTKETIGDTFGVKTNLATD